jgi:hypothetical protein
MRAGPRRRSPTPDRFRRARDRRGDSGQPRHRTPSTRAPRIASTTRRSRPQRRHSARTYQPSRSRSGLHSGCESSSASRPPQTKQVRRPPSWISSAIASRARSSFQLAAAHLPDPPTLQWCSHASQIGHVARRPQSGHRTDRRLARLTIAAHVFSLSPRAPTALRSPPPPPHDEPTPIECVHARRSSEERALCNAPPGIGGRTTRRQFVTCHRCLEVIAHRLRNR